jgi:hypothetical protein
MGGRNSATARRGRGFDRAADLFAALSRVLREVDRLIAMGRLGSPSVECNFGPGRAAFRSGDRRTPWLSAEVQAARAAEFILDLDFPEHRRRPRNPLSGGVTPRVCANRLAKPAGRLVSAR